MVKHSTHSKLTRKGESYRSKVNSDAYQIEETTNALMWRSEYRGYKSDHMTNQEYMVELEVWYPKYTTNKS
jgi:hypothetical protein